MDNPAATTPAWFSLKSDGLAVKNGSESAVCKANWTFIGWIGSITGRLLD